MSVFCFEALSKFPYKRKEIYSENSLIHNSFYNVRSQRLGQHTNWDHSKGLVLLPCVAQWITGVIESVFECSGPTATALLHWQGQLSGRIPPLHLMPVPIFIQSTFPGHFGYRRLQYWLLLRKLLLKGIQS